MDDQFLHRLRREPPADFARRLKWQLDRPAPVSRFRSRLLLGLALCGTAFALVSPPGRRVLGDWLATTTSHPQPAAPESSRPRASTPSAAPSTGVSQGSTLQRVGPLRDRPPTFSAPAPTALPSEAAAPLDAGPNVGQQSTGITFTPTTIVAAPLQAQTPEMRAMAAISLRRGLFLNLGFVAQPLAMMLRRGSPLDFNAVRLEALRLQTLSSMIPELFGPDTRPFGMNTAALDSIWAEPNAFEAKADELILAADALATAAATDDDVATPKAIHRVEAACTACHDVYRRK